MKTNMSQPADAVTAIFSLAVGLAILAIVRSTFTGGDVNELANTISNLTVPFLFFLFILYITLSLIEV